MCELLTARSCGRIKCLYHSAPVSAVPVRSDVCILRRADSLPVTLVLTAQGSFVNRPHTRYCTWEIGKKGALLLGAR